ncbi:hypothetical protein ACVCNR_09635 [Aquamicrobium terrae]
MSNNHRRSAPARRKGGRMMRKSHTAPINGNPADYLPTYHHSPLEAGYHEIPIYGPEAWVVVCAGSDGHFLKITVGQRKPL